MNSLQEFQAGVGGAEDDGLGFANNADTGPGDTLGSELGQTLKNVGFVSRS